MMKRLSIFLIVLSGIFLLIQPDSVHACTPTVAATPGGATVTPFPAMTVEDRINHAQIVLLGTVVGKDNSHAEVEVEYYFKGDGEARINIYGLGGGSLCQAWVTEGDRYIFLANSGRDGDLQASYYLRYASPLIIPSDENIEQITAFTNQSIAPNPMTVNQQIQRAVNQDKSLRVIAGVASSLIVLMGLLTFKMRKNTRKSKTKRP